MRGANDTQSWSALFPRNSGYRPSILFRLSKSTRLRFVRSFRHIPVS